MMIEGARRVGKSNIVKEFAQREYKSYILIDFFKVGDDIKDLFKNYKDNLDMLFTYLSTYFSTRLHPRESIIVFDEIEFCPAARAAIKYLVEDGRYDYLETGSLLGMKTSTQKKKKDEDKRDDDYRIPSMKPSPPSFNYMITSSSWPTWTRMPVFAITPARSSGCATPRW